MLMTFHPENEIQRRINKSFEIACANEKKEYNFFFFLALSLQLVEKHLNTFQSINIFLFFVFTSTLCARPKKIHLWIEEEEIEGIEHVLYDDFISMDNIFE